MAEVKNIEDAYFEVEKDIIIAYNSDPIDENVLPESNTIVFAQVEEPEGLIGLNTRYIDLDISQRPVLNTVSELATLRAQLRSLSIDIDLAQRLKEDTTALQTQFTELATQYNNLNTPK